MCVQFQFAIMAYIKMVMGEKQFNQIDTELQAELHIQSARAKTFVNEAMQVQANLEVIHKALASTRRETVIMKKRDLRAMAEIIGNTLEKLIDSEVASVSEHETFIKTKEMERIQMQTKRRKVMWF